VGWLTGGSNAQNINSGFAIVTVGELGAFPDETYAATFFAGATLDNLVVGMNGQSAGAVTFTVFINGSLSALACTVSANSGNACVDTSHSVLVSAGQTFSVHVSGNLPGIPVHFRVRVH
jgi:hypothetical protein